MFLAFCTAFKLLLLFQVRFELLMRLCELDYNSGIFTGRVVVCKTVLITQVTEDCFVMQR